MKITFDKYIDNPAGGSVFTNRSMYKNMYLTKFNKLLVREQGLIRFRIFRSDDAFDAYYIYMKIPSEMVDNFYYDVVIKLYTDDNEKKNSANLRGYYVKFYANDPAFVYTFAYTFAHSELFVNELSSKMSNKYIQHEAKVKNPGNNVWYVKSLYFAYLTMEKYNLFNRVMLNNNALRYKKNALLALVTQAELKVKARQDAQERINKEKKEARKKQQIEKEKLRNQSIQVKHSNMISSTKQTQSVKSTRSTRRSRTIK